jgi:hypothetical protein
MKDQVIIIDLNIYVLKHDSTKKKLELLLNMFGLQAVTNVPTRTYKETKSTIKQVILNPKLWDFKTQVSETTMSDHFGQIIKAKTHCNKRILTLGLRSKKFLLLLLYWVHFEPIFLKLLSQLWFSNS